MSSCLGGGGGGRTYRLDLDIVKSSAASASASASASALSSAPARSSSSSSSSASSSVLSDSSNSPLLAISIKKPRAPRKRPNQTYNEAAALLSTAYPTVFLPSKALSKQPKPLLLSHSSSSKFPDPSADLLPAFPVLGSDAAFLIRRPADQKPLHPDAAAAAAAEQQPALSSPTSALTAEFRDGGCNSPALSPAVSNEFREPPDSPAFSSDDFDAESILDEEAAAAEQGIDAILGNLSMSASANSNENENENETGNENENSHSIRSCSVNPYIKSLMGFGLLGSKFELGLGFTYGRSVHRALRQRDGGYRWSSPTVPVKDICSKFKAPTAPSSAPPPLPEVKKSKKKSKKVEKKVLVDTDSPAAAAATPAATADAGQAEVGSKRVALGLKLNHDEVLKAWSDRGSMFSSDGPDSPNSSAEALAKLADIDLVPENGAAREASVMRYKEKRRSRLFAKKIRYQVRKVNADCRPRMKGRFVRRPSLLQQAIEEES